MEEERISVIVPIYKVEKYLEQCIASVCAQTYQNLEIILVDDGSPDDCGKICDAWAEKDNRIRVIHQDNGGVSKARNAGLDVASGEYITFVDPDDFISPVMYECLTNCLKERKCDIAMCAYQIVDDNGDYMLEEFATIPFGELTMEEMMTLQYVNPRYHCTVDVVWNKLFPRRIIDSLRFREGKIHEDVFFLNDYLTRVKRVAVTDEELYFYRQRPTSIMREAFSGKRIVRFYALRDRVDVCKTQGFSENCVRSNAVRCVNEGIGFWLNIKARKLLQSSDEKFFYQDVILSCKQFKKYGSIKNLLLWKTFQHFPGVMLFFFKLKRTISKKP